MNDQNINHDATAEDIGVRVTMPFVGTSSLMGFIGGVNNAPIDAANSVPVSDATRMTLDLATRQITDHARGLRSVRSPLTQIKVSGDRLITGDREYRIDAGGMRKLAGYFRAPIDYLNKLSPRLRDDLLNYHLHSAPSPGGNRVYYRDGTFVGLGRSDLHTLDSAEVLNAVRDGFGTDALSFEVQRLGVADEAFSLDLVTPRIAVEVRRGDEIQAGLRVEHSYTGDRATTVLAFAVRLVCTNGMVHRECIGSRRTSRTRRLNADREDAGMLQYDQIRRLAKEVHGTLAPKLDAIRKLADQRADKAELKKFLAQARLGSKGVVDSLGESWEAEGNEQTAFGLFNALTRQATHGSLPARQRGILARLAGVYANRANHICPHCFSVLNSPAAI